MTICRDAVYRVNTDKSWYDKKSDESLGVNSNLEYLGKSNRTEFNTTQILQEALELGNATYATFNADTKVSKNVRIQNDFTVSGDVEIGAIESPPDALYGTPVILTVHGSVNSTTSFSQKDGSFTFDLGGMLADSAAVSPLIWSRSTYSTHVSQIFHGFLKSWVKGKWVVKVTWMVRHTQAPDDPYDGLDFSFSLGFTGFKLFSVFRPAIGPSGYCSFDEMSLPSSFVVINEEHCEEE